HDIQDIFVLLCRTPKTWRTRIFQPLSQHKSERRKGRMKTRYIDLIEQTFDFPKDEFKLEGDNLEWNDLPLMEILQKHGTPLRITYLPKIGEKIEMARNSFAKAFETHQYSGEYKYFYCTKSNHFSYVIDKVLNKGVDLETSSAYDLDM